MNQVRNQSSRLGQRSMIAQISSVILSQYTGNKFIPAFVTENMVGHKFGEFAPTRNFRGHIAKKDKRK